MKLRDMMFVLFSIFLTAYILEQKLNKIQRDLEHVVVLLDEGTCE